MGHKLQLERYAATRICSKCGWRDSTTIEQQPFTPPPAIAELEQGEWSCTNGCGDACTITVEKLPPAWQRAFRR